MLKLDSAFDYSSKITGVSGNIVLSLNQSMFYSLGRNAIQFAFVIIISNFF